MTLFDFNASSQLLSHGPLAHRMRPMNLNDFIGHSDIIGDNSIIKNALENNQLFSMIFWGPPGCGKTTLAKLIGNTDNYIFSEIFIRDKNLKLSPIKQNGLIQTLSLLPLSYPGHNILTEDIGALEGVDDCRCGRKGKYFSIKGRVPGTELRGCSDVN